MSSVSADARSNELHFREYTLIFISLLYGAAIHLVIVHTRAESRRLLFTSTVLLVSLILFLFSDWASRTRLPGLLPENVTQKLYVVKTGLELLGVVFLSLSFIQLVDPPSPIVGEPGPASLTAATAFAVFLMSTFLWDYLMLYIMKDLKYSQLWSAVLNGTAGKNQSILHYLAPFEVLREQQMEKLSQLGKKLTSLIEGKPWRPHVARTIEHWFLCLAVFLLDGAQALLLQLLANHTAHANLSAATIILVDESYLQGKAMFDVAPPTGMLASAATLGVALVCALLFLLFTFLLLTPLSRRLFWVLVVISVSVLIAARPALAGAAQAHRSYTLYAVGFLLFGILLLTLLALNVRSKTRGGGYCGTAAGLLVGGGLLFLYLTSQPVLIMLMLGCQQVFANLFLQFFAGASTKVPPVTV